MMLSLGIGLGLGLALVAKVLALSGHTEVTDFLLSIHSFRPTGLLLTVAGIESVLIFQVLVQILVSIAVGWKIMSVLLGPVRISRYKKTWRLAFNKTFVPHWVTSIPTSHRPPGWRLFIFLASAPFSLFAIATISLLGYLHLPEQSLLRNYLAAAALFGFSVALFYLFPNARSARVWNSARFFLALLTKDPELPNRITTARLLGFAQQRLRPRDLPPDLVSSAAKPATDATSAILRASLIGSWCLDHKDLASAGAWYDRLAELASHGAPALKDSALASSACFDLAWRENLESAARKLRDVKPELLPTPSHRLCTQALIHIVYGDRIKAESVIALAEEHCSGAVGDYQRETLIRLRAIAENLPPNPILQKI